MTTLADPVVLGPPDFVRDQWGRPLVIPPDGGNPRPYTRSSSAAKTVEDTYNLELWARRNVAYGMAKDRSLIARVLALGGDPSTWDLATKKACNAIVEDAAAVALAHRAADIGTAVHRMTEMLDRGQPVDAGPYEADLEAYVERPRRRRVDRGRGRVPPRLRRPGDGRHRRPDPAQRLAPLHRRHQDRRDGRLRRARLGGAARRLRPRPALRPRHRRAHRPARPRPDHRPDHPPAGRAGACARCTRSTSSPATGRRTWPTRSAPCAAQARRWIAPLSPGEVSPAPVTLPSAEVGAGDRREALRDRYLSLDGHRQAAFRARNLDPDDLDAIEAALDELEPRRVDPDLLAASVDVGDAQRGPAAGDTGAEGCAWTRSPATRSTAGTCISFRFEPFERNVHLCRALLNCCAASLDDDDLRVLVEAVIGDEVQPSITLGAALGALTLAEAERLDEMTSPRQEKEHEHVQGPIGRRPDHLQRPRRRPAAVHRQEPGGRHRDVASARPTRCAPTSSSSTARTRARNSPTP